jgi:hypothetical protein
LAWTNLTYIYGSQLTATKMNQLYDNFAAMAGANTGAPRLASASLETALVTQSRLSTATASGLAGGTYTLVGGTYSWWTASSTGGEFVDTGITGAGLSSISGSAYYDERYIQASPPYDFGDGAIPLFLFMVIGDNRQFSAAPDPVWHYNPGAAHPFRGQRAVLLNPFSKTIERLALMHAHMSSRDYAELVPYLRISPVAVAFRLPVAVELADVRLQ